MMKGKKQRSGYFPVALEIKKKRQWRVCGVLFTMVTTMGRNNLHKDMYKYGEMMGAKAKYILPNSNGSDQQGTHTTRRRNQKLI